LAAAFGEGDVLSILARLGLTVVIVCGLVVRHNMGGAPLKKKRVVSTGNVSLQDQLLEVSAEDKTNDSEDEDEEGDCDDDEEEEDEDANVVRQESSDQFNPILQHDSDVRDFRGTSETDRPSSRDPSRTSSEVKARSADSGEWL
jgi:hypothetical protein